MTLPKAVIHPSLRPGLILFLSGAFLTLTAAIYCFAWNWHALPGAVRFALTGGGTALCLMLAFAAERKNHDGAASLALFSAALFTGLCWTVFGQIFQSGSTAREFCLAWAATTAPLFLLRRRAPLWNLLFILISIAACTDPPLDLQNGTYTSHILAPLLVAAAGCLAALLPPALIGRSPGQNSWLALPLTLLLAEATALCSLDILFLPHQYQPSLPELLAGPTALSAVLLFAILARHTLALCETALCGIVLLNIALCRMLEHLDTTELTALLTLINTVCTFIFAAVLPKFPQGKERTRFRSALTHAPAILGGCLSAVCLIILTATFFNGANSATTLFHAGLIYTPCGVLLWRIRRKNIFSAVLGAVLVTGGALCFHIGLLEYSPGIILPAVWTTAAVLYAVIDSGPLRFSAAFWALLSTDIFFPLIVPSRSFAALSVFFLCSLPLLAATANRFPRGFLRPAAFACICTLLMMSPSFPSPSPTHISMGTVEAKIAVTFTALNLALLLRLRIPPSACPNRPATYAAGVAVILVLWYLSPQENLIALTLLLGALGTGISRSSASEEAPILSCDRTMMFLGIFTLMVNSVLFYYLTMFTFRTKMIYFGIPGLCMLVFGLWLEGAFAPVHKKNTAAVRTPALRQALSFFLGAAVAAGIFVVSAADKNAILRDGRTVLLPLVPNDPRALLLGDYMALSYRLDRQFQDFKSGPGCLPLIVDENGIASPSPEGVLPEKDCTEFSGPALSVEKTLPGRTRPRLPRRWYFEEGLGPLYAEAAFAVLRMDAKNRILLEGLADDTGKLLQPIQETTGSR